MFKVFEITDFCIRSSRLRALAPISFLNSSPTSLGVQSNHPVRQLLRCTIQPSNHCISACFSSHIMGPYLSVFSSSFLALLSIHGQLISIVQTSFLSWLTSRASIRFYYYYYYYYYYYFVENVITCPSSRGLFCLRSNFALNFPLWSNFIVLFQIEMQPICICCKFFFRRP